MTSLSSMTK